MADSGKIIADLADRISYLVDIKGGGDWANLDELLERVHRLKESVFDLSEAALFEELRLLEERISFLEDRTAEKLTPAEIVNIVRSPQRFTLGDILENVYDSYTELGGEGDCNVDPAVVVARAILNRRVKNRVYSHQVMVIGHEKGRGEEFRNGGCAKPWGNEKALRYMKVAEIEGIPIHFFIFTPGSYPIEDFPGAAQQIARNLYKMAGLRVPMVSFISEGGSGGAEAIGLADLRLMGSRGYYSVISPEGAAAIEGKIREGQKVPKELVDHCAAQLRMTAADNLRLGTVDRIVEEPPLGARREDYGFFRRLRYEMIRATDEVVLKTKSFRAFRAYALKSQGREGDPVPDEFDVLVGWELTDLEKDRLVELRSKKYRDMARRFLKEHQGGLSKGLGRARDIAARSYYELRYGLLRAHQRQVQKVIEEVSSEGSVFLRKVTEPVKAAYDFVFPKPKRPAKAVRTDGADTSIFVEEWETYVSPLANEDRTVSCPNAARRGCQDLWVPDLYGEFCGVCPTCGHHFPLEYHWYLENLFDKGSVREFNAHIAAGNPLGFEGFDKRLRRDVKKTGRRSSMITFDAKVQGIKLVVAMLYSDFRNGTVGSAEGEKFVRACDRARTTRRPLLAYIHTTGGIRIHEGTLGVIQMPKCTVAVREYIESGGLYIVVYDNNSYAGPVASFLGCSLYQFAIRSSRIGFAGPRVIRETTGEDVPPDYHSAKNALRRGHIQGIWDRKEFRKNLFNALVRMGGPHLYYK
ncbi:acetyl-CoA carboxylase carboxyl transferase subunit alpha/beta [Dissulfurirhabdus thermomarina]|uniref:Acetyl-coenzyme A carboxylase carboxyl transferase subunits beta/alpha n=2 Tax=Dissulfurirhabdus thermomarina TaxID=1765737 RepID=A0A6N9TTA0_DISTH|nr:acetyl-CoA carboxylase carboxyl transferase subunit alpha/beta [Dissulfurirhabdus thermomarina]NMX23202.1 acetyl-CoA carboxylase carboxyl transferase subunit alpha/beta [Dissulfurirhabdus thermomarina]